MTNLKYTLLILLAETRNWLALLHQVCEYHPVSNMTQHIHSNKVEPERWGSGFLPNTAHNYIVQLPFPPTPFYEKKNPTSEWQVFKPWNKSVFTVPLTFFYHSGY